MYKFAITALFTFSLSLNCFAAETWQCVAEGKTHLNEEFMEVSGWPASSEKQAEKEALMACTAAGLTSCVVLYCEEVLP